MFFLAAELGMTVQELTSKLTKKEYEDKAIQNAKDKSRARKP